MTPTETTRLLALVAAVCPAQAIGEHTAEAWHLVLGHLPYDLACKAVIEAARHERWVAPADVVKHARALKAAAIEQVSPLAVPDADPDDPAAYTRALREGRYRVPEGLHPIPAGHPMRALTA